MEFTDEIKTFFASVVGRGGTSIDIMFEGGGDSGYIEDITVHGTESPLSTEENRFLEDWAYDFLSYTIDYDWVNNEGGGGTLSIDLEDGGWEIDGYYRTTEHVVDSGSIA